MKTLLQQEDDHEILNAPHFQLLYDIVGIDTLALVSVASASLQSEVIVLVVVKKSILCLP